MKWHSVCPNHRAAAYLEDMDVFGDSNASGPSNPDNGEKHHQITKWLHRSPTNSQQKKTGKAASIPNYLRRKLLNLIRDRPELSFKDLDVKIEHKNGVKLSTKEVFKVARRYLRCKLRDGILGWQLKREEIDDFINGWQFGKDMEFHRKGCNKEYGEYLWRERNRMDVQAAISAPVNNEEDEQMEVDDGEEKDTTIDAAEHKLCIPNYQNKFVQILSKPFFTFHQLNNFVYLSRQSKEVTLSLKYHKGAEVDCILLFMIR
ncbi:unnamed protein product [Caenorhabditis brenneri]